MIMSPYVLVAIDYIPGHSYCPKWSIGHTRSWAVRAFLFPNWLCNCGLFVTEGFMLGTKKRGAPHDHPVSMLPLTLQPACKIQLDGAKHQATWSCSLPWMLKGSGKASVQQAFAAVCQCRQGKETLQTLKPEKAWCSTSLYYMMR